MIYMIYYYGCNVLYIYILSLEILNLHSKIWLRIGKSFYQKIYVNGMEYSVAQKTGHWSALEYRSRYKYPITIHTVQYIYTGIVFSTQPLKQVRRGGGGEGGGGQNPPTPTEQHLASPVHYRSVFTTVKSPVFALSLFVHRYNVIFSETARSIQYFCDNFVSSFVCKKSRFRVTMR